VPDGDNGWYRHDVTVKLVGSSEIGVKSISYSTGGPVTVVPGNTATVVISTEGINNLAYWATDNAGAVGLTKTLTIKLDKTAPEFDIAFDTTARAFKMTTVDSVSGPATSPVVFMESMAINNYLLKDKAGNTLAVTLELDRSKWDLWAGVIVRKLSYNGGPVIVPPDPNKLQASWTGEEGKPLKSLNQEWSVYQQFLVRANFNAKTNTTKISGALTRTDTGLTILHATTLNGKLVFKL